MSNISIIKQLFSELSESEKKAFLDSVSHDRIPTIGKHLHGSIHELLSSTRSNVCPHCRSSSVRKWSIRKDGTRRYICKECRHTFTLATNTVFHSAKKDVSVYEYYIELMLDGTVLRKAAELCGISLKTSFLWRQKFLDTLKSLMDSVRLDGIVESDETFFAISYKGSRKLPRPAHRRGEKASKRGLSKEKVCVPCAVNRDGKSVARITNLGRVAVADVERAFGANLVDGSVLCTDKCQSYQPVAERHGMELVQFKGGESRVRGVFHIQHVNAYHREVKARVNGHFRGVASKYLNNYLMWHNMVSYGKSSFDELLYAVAGADSIGRSRNLQSRRALPLLR